MTSGKIFRAQRNARLDSGHMFTRQSSEALRIISNLLGWIPDVVIVQFDALGETFDTNARSPEKFMNVCDVKVSDYGGFSVPPHDDQGRQLDHERAKYGLRVSPVRLFSAFAFRRCHFVAR